MQDRFEVLYAPIVNLIEKYPTGAEIFAGLVLIGLCARPLRAAVALLQEWLSPTFQLLRESYSHAQREASREFRRYRRLRASLFFALAACSVFAAIYALGVVVFGVTGLFLYADQPDASKLGAMAIGALIGVCGGILFYMLANARLFGRYGIKVWQKRY